MRQLYILRSYVSGGEKDGWLRCAFLSTFNNLFLHKYVKQTKLDGWKRDVWRKQFTKRAKKEIPSPDGGWWALLPAGLEPATFALPRLWVVKTLKVLVRSSNQLSYGSQSGWRIWWMWLHFRSWDGSEFVEWRCTYYGIYRNFNVEDMHNLQFACLLKASILGEPSK
jgi:hypothetical protein